MKTAMQEIRDDLSQIFHENQIPLKIDISKYLEKEKEQIIESYYEGHTAPYFSPYGNDVEKQAENYYNETYNQNK